MPLQNIESLSGDRMIGYWKLSEPYDLLLEQVNLALEDGSFGKITHETKLREWASTRILSEAMLSKWGVQYEGITKDDWGKPHLNQTDIWMSVTHSFPYVVVMMDKFQPVGIDIEAPSPKISRIAHKFLHEKEAYAKTDKISQTIIWAAKEALYKYHGRKRLSFREQIIIDKFKNSEHGAISGRIIENGIKEEHQLVYKYVYEKDYLLVYTC